ncbi:hypothetical protein TSUD_183530 [Trifolium subterraneum]|uniref:Uncharacterized protein n=1 Tax=Trifolium subterraneum TaxID=3900 RepID=A0A2Z6LW65_TRISU|nr:hypothetical protein TSUD_183530 [Trifolium subterraneum]
MKGYSPAMGTSSHRVLLARKGLHAPMRVIRLVVLSGMDTASKFTSPVSILRFREGYSLYNDDGEDELVIVETVRADELVTTVNREEPHYFYMYANVIQTLNLWFPLTFFEDTISRLLNVAPSQFHPNSWAFVKGYELLCYALDLEPSLGSWAIKGVYDDVLTSFEKETITFLESFNLIDIKDLLRRETNVKRLTNFIRRMKTVSDEEWMSFLAKSKAKKLQPDEIFLPDDLPVVGETKGSKRKRRGDRVIRGGRPKMWMGEFVVDGGVTVQTAGPPPAVAGIGSSVWGSTFDPAAFVENTLLGTGDSARFDSLTTSELRNLALSYDVKGTVLTHLLSARRDKEILEANSKVTRAEQVVTNVERTKHADEKASLRTKETILEAEVTTLEVLRNNLIVSLTQSRKDISELEEDVDELEETNTALKQSMADKYVDGFWSSIEQVKILFPELDPDVLAQVDVLKRIKDGKLI